MLPHPNLILRVIQLLPLFFLVAASHAAERVGAAKEIRRDGNNQVRYFQFNLSNLKNMGIK